MIREFRVEIEQEALDDLRERLDRTRWPRSLPGNKWSRGAPVDYLRRGRPVSPCSRPIRRFGGC